MKHQQKSELPESSYGNQKCMFVDSLTEYIGLTLVSPPKEREIGR